MEFTPTYKGARVAIYGSGDTWPSTAELPNSRLRDLYPKFDEIVARSARGHECEICGPAERLAPRVCSIDTESLSGYLDLSDQCPHVRLRVLRWPCTMYEAVHPDCNGDDVHLTEMWKTVVHQGPPGPNFMLCGSVKGYPAYPPIFCDQSLTVTSERQRGTITLRYRDSGTSDFILFTSREPAANRKMWPTTGVWLYSIRAVSGALVSYSSGCRQSHRTVPVKMDIACGWTRLPFLGRARRINTDTAIGRSSVHVACSDVFALRCVVGREEFTLPDDPRLIDTQALQSMSGAVPFEPDDTTDGTIRKFQKLAVRHAFSPTGAIGAKHIGCIGEIIDECAS